MVNLKSLVGMVPNKGYLVTFVVGILTGTAIPNLAGKPLLDNVLAVGMLAILIGGVVYNLLLAKNWLVKCTTTA